MDIQKFKDNIELIYETGLVEFEELVAELVRNSVWNVSLTTQMIDRRYDIFATKTDNIGEITSIIEVKHYGRGKGRGRGRGIQIVRELYNVKYLLGVSQGIIVTSSTFTKEAKDFANSRYDISLIDIETLKKLIIDYKPKKETHHFFNQ